MEDQQLNHAPCGFLTLSKDNNILSINQTLLDILEYERGQLIGKQMNTILSMPARMFYQLYFIPPLKVGKKVEEMYISLVSRNGEEVPVLINAHQKVREGISTIECVLIPMRKRNAYENELLLAKKEAEAALAAKNKVNHELEITLKELEAKQNELIELNKQNQQYKIETEKELQLAKKIQQTSLTEPITSEHLEIETYYRASNELSGDMYGFYQINPSQFGIIILDVMGHGISSSLITMSLQSLFQRLISKGVTANEVMKELDTHLHTLFHNDEEAWHYCTAIYLGIDTEKKQVDYINAGHPPALWLDDNGNLFELYSTTPPLGTFDGIEFKKNTFSYKKGGRLLLYTDGVIEPHDSSKLGSILSEYQSKPLAIVKEKIIESILKTTYNYHQSDDECFILVDLK